MREKVFGFWVVNVAAAMVAAISVNAVTTQAMKEEVVPLLPLLEDYSDVNSEPKVLLLRNPLLPSTQYESWQKDYRFGRFTSPTPGHRAWTEGGAIDRMAQKCLKPNLVCVSAMIISYSKTGAHVGYHKDPSAYERIVSLTLEGDGVMKVRSGNGKALAYDLVPGVGVVLEDEDCLRAKHSIHSSARLGLVIRYASATHFGKQIVHRRGSKEEIKTSYLGKDNGSL